MTYTIEEDELQDLKGKMMDNPNLFTAGLIVAQTDLVGLMSDTFTVA